MESGFVSMETHEAEEDAFQFPNHLRAFAALPPCLSIMLPSHASSPPGWSLSFRRVGVIATKISRLTLAVENYIVLRRTQSFTVRPSVPSIRSSRSPQWPQPDDCPRHTPVVLV